MNAVYTQHTYVIIRYQTITNTKASSCTASQCSSTSTSHDVPLRYVLWRHQKPTITGTKQIHGNQQAWVTSP